MSNLQYFDYEGWGERSTREVHYSQAVRVGEIIKISGQGGWDRISEEIPTDGEKEIAQAFANVEHTLQKAGGKGWDQVYQVRVYCLDMGPALEPLIENLKKYCPDHAPLLTAVVVKGLYGKMTIEIEVEAYVG